MFTVALVGLDGAGKSTIARRVARTLPVPARYVYMGINLESSALLLPTTRLALELKRLRGGRPDLTGPARAGGRRRGPLGQLARAVTALFRAAVMIPEEWFRQVLICYHRVRGRVVVCDRHFVPDYHAAGFGIAAQDATVADRIHGFVLQALYPKPDLTICLDGPAAALFARKGAASADDLERRRRGYLHLGAVTAHFEVVDATQPEDAVAAQVADLVLGSLAARPRRVAVPTARGRQLLLK